MQRLKNIDSMRGLAALAVIYTHVSEYGIGHHAVSNQLERFIFSVFTEYMNLGKVAVIVFFGISGFVIPFSLFKYKSRTVLFFAISRVFRLFPAYWLSMALALIVLFYFEGRPITSTLVLANATMLQQFLGIPNIVEVYWTLQIELIFYVLCALLFARQKLDSAKFVTGVAVFCLFAALALAFARFTLDKKLPVALPLSLGVMFWGLALRYYLAENIAAWRSAVLIISAALIASIPPISLLAYSKDMGLHETWYKYTISYYSALFLFIVLYRFCNLNSPALVFLGTISYSVYLFGAIVQAALCNYFGPDIFNLSGHAVIAIAMVITIALSAWVYLFVELPSNALAKSIIESLNGTPSGKQAVTSL